MEKEEKIKLIYKKIANKTIDNNCKVILNNWKTIRLNSLNEYFYDYVGNGMVEVVKKEELNEFVDIKEIIWQNVLIWDVLNYIDEKNYVSDDSIELLAIWNKLNEPIDNQSDECIDFVFSLLK